MDCLTVSDSGVIVVSDERRYSTTELLPCPFCGGVPERLTDDEGRWTQISCTGCGCRSVEHPNPSPGVLERYWNRRPLPSTTEREQCAKIAIDSKENEP